MFLGGRRTAGAAVFDARDDGSGRQSRIHTGNTAGHDQAQHHRDNDAGHHILGVQVTADRHRCG